MKTKPKVKTVTKAAKPRSAEARRSLERVGGPLGRGCERMTASIYAIVALHALEELTEGQCVKLMNSPERVSYRLTREKVIAEMRERLREDMERHGWKWPTVSSSAATPGERSTDVR